MENANWYTLDWLQIDQRDGLKTSDFRFFCDTGKKLVFFSTNPIIVELSHLKNEYHLVS